MLVNKILIFLLATCLSSAEDEEITDFYPLENPDLLEGDILEFEDDRNAIVNKKNLWPSGVVPFVLDQGLSSTVSISLVKSAMQDYEDNTCIRFVPRTTQENYVHIFPGKGCYAHIGMGSGMQTVSLGKGCGYRGTIIHELGHALGFYHEHNRSDRDQFVNILWENIKTGQESQFTLRKPNQNLLLTPFDFDSIMLYGSYTFSKDRGNLRTIVRKNGEDVKSVILKKFLSASDIVRINKLYQC